VPITASHAPIIVAAGGEKTAFRFLEFVTAQIRDPHTRRAYARAEGGTLNLAIPLPHAAAGDTSAEIRAPRSRSATANS